MKIKVTRNGGTYHASLADNLEICGCGTSTHAAIGNLISLHREIFNLEIEVEDNPIINYGVYTNKLSTEIRILCSNCASLPRTPSTGWEVIYSQTLEWAKKSVNFAFNRRYKRGADCEHCKITKQ